jgi:Ca2+:H+ antiporter
MTEPSSVSSPVSSPNAIPQPTSLALLSEDDDEPPSSGSNDRPPQVKYQKHIVDNGQDDVKEKVVEVPEKQQADVSVPPVLSRNHSTKKKSSLMDRLRSAFTPKKNIGPRPTYKQSAMATLRYTPLNICLVFIPVSWAMHYTHQSSTLIFVFSCLGIIPLAALLGLGTEQIALRTSQSIGGLLNATLGNIVELIIAIIALQRVCIYCYSLLSCSHLAFSVN